MTESAPPIDEPRPTTWDTTSNVVDWLLAPLAPAPGVRQRRARLLSWMLVGILGVLGVAIVLTLLFGPAARIRANEYLGVVAALGLTLTLAYAVNAAGYYTAAAWMMIVPAATEPWIALIADPAIMRGDFVPLMYVCVSVLLAGFLFSPSTTLVLAAAQFTGLLLIPVLVPSARTFNWISALLLVLMVSALGLLMSSIVRRDLEELDMQAQQLAESEARMRELSIRDFLTGLFNRRHLGESLDHEIARAERAEGTLGVIVFDVDNLKEINDRSGHAAGDEVLKQLGRVAAANTRGSDLACRCGGDEFVVVLPGASRHATVERAEALRDMISALEFEPEVLETSGVTVSLGTAVYPQNGRTADEVLAAADEALYRAKRGGRNQAVSAR